MLSHQIRMYQYHRSPLSMRDPYHVGIFGEIMLSLLNSMFTEARRGEKEYELDFKQLAENIQKIRYIPVARMQSQQQIP